MNHYKYIVLKIQDMSDGSFVHSAIGTDAYEDQSYFLSDNPIQYYVKSDDIEGLLAAKEIMIAALNSIYEVSTQSEEEELDEDGFEVAVLKKVPVYLDNFMYYNMKVREAANTKKGDKGYLKIKKIHKNRFQLLENFTSHSMEEIELYDESV